MSIYITSIWLCPTGGGVQEKDLNLSFGWYYFSDGLKPLFPYNFHRGVGNNHDIVQAKKKQTTLSKNYDFT